MGVLNSKAVVVLSQGLAKDIAMWKRQAQSQDPLALCRASNRAKGQCGWPRKVSGWGH